MLVAVAIAVVHPSGRVLLLRRRPDRDAGAGLWETPSGRLEPGEPPLDAARRELAEETGLLLPLDLRPVDAYAARRGSEPMVVIVYRAAVEGPASTPPPAVRLSDEHDALRWVTLDEARRLGVPERLRLALEQALRLPWPPPGERKQPAPQR